MTPSNSAFRICRVVAAILCTTGLAACSGTPTGPNAGGASPLSLAAVNGVGELGEFEVCKQYSGAAGPTVTVNYTVDFDGNGSIENSGSVQLADGGCAVVHSYVDAGSNNGLQVQRVTVTEQTPPGYTASYTKTTVLLSGSSTVGPIAGNSASGDLQGNNPDNGFLVVFTNTSIPTTSGTGRFTGGGAQIEIGGAKVTRGLTIHCDKLLSNNLEVNWDGNSFHMEEHLTTVACTDDPGVDQKPPTAPIDTLIGTGVGRFNGSGGYTIEFTLVDAGEPGKNDLARLLIYPTGNPGGAVLNVPLQTLTNGNLQAHFDQPHK